MRKLCIAVFFLALASCRKDPAHIAEPIAQQPGKDSVEAPGNSPFLGDLDIDGINYLPSDKPMVLISTAYGRDTGNGHRQAYPLSTSGWTHPSVIHQTLPWNGFTYWMAITPYPNIDSQYENPHIFCSNNGVNWQEPAGIINPIEPCPPGDGYNSDVNLMMENNTLYCYFRVSGVLSGRALYVVKSNDGVHWSQKELLCDWPFTVIDVIAPSMVKSDGNYHCYGICLGETTPGEYYTNISIRKMVSSDPVKGFRPVRDVDYNLIKIKGRPWGSSQDPWHLEVQKLNNIWLMLVTTTNHGGFGSGGRLFLGYSKDGVNFNFGTKPIISTSGTYKSSFHPSYDPLTKKIHIELWRAMMSNGWAVYHEEFDIRTGPQFIV